MTSRPISVQERESQRRVAMARALHRRATNMPMAVAASLVARTFLLDEVDDPIETLRRQPEGWWPRGIDRVAENNLVRAVRRAERRECTPARPPGRWKADAHPMLDVPTDPDFGVECLARDAEAMSDGLDVLIALTAEELATAIAETGVPNIETCNRASVATPFW